LKVEDLKFDSATGLIPVVVQHHATGEVLMFAYANLEAVKLTLEKRVAYFWSRSRKKLWMKGEESGNIMKIIDVKIDCDGDALLYIVDPLGPACHTGQNTCFHNRLTF